MAILAGIEATLRPYGPAGAGIAALVALLCLVLGVFSAREALRQLTFTHPEMTRRDLVLHAVGYAVLALVFLAIALLFGWLSGAIFGAGLSWLIASCFVFAFGGAVGAAELVSRYRDQPARALTTAPAVFYISLNAFAAAGALYLIYVYRDKLGFAEANGDWSSNPGTLVQAVLIAGFSSLLFFRSSLFKFRVGDSDLAVGPSIVLDTLLAAADRAVDRVMAEPRAQFVHDLMGEVAFEKAAAILPGHCIALMQNVSSEESQRLAGVVNSLRADKEMPDRIKALNLGLALLTVVGARVLRTAVDGLRVDLEDSTAHVMQEVAVVMRAVSFDRARRMLPPYCFALWPKAVPDELQAKLAAESTALGALADVPEDYKALLLGIRLVRLTDGATLRKAVEDLGESIRTRALPAPTPNPAAPPAPPPPPAPPAEPGS